MVEVVRGKFGPRPCEDLADQLRLMAEQAERGELIDFVAAYTLNGEYHMFRAASLETSVVLASMLWDDSVQKFKV